MSKKSSKLIALIMTVLMVMIIFSGCSTSNPVSGSKAPVATAAATAKPTSIDKSNPIWIGALCCLTGDGSGTDIPGRDAILWAAEKINASGGVLGRELKVEIVDTQSTPDGTVSAAAKLIGNKDICAVICPARSALSSSITAIMEEAKMPWICFSVGVKLTQSNKNPYMFFARANDIIVASAGAKFINEELKLKKIGIFYNNDDSGNSGKDALIAYFKDHGIEYVAQGHNTGDTDFSGQIVAFKEANVDLVVAWTHYTGMATLLKQRYEMGLKAPVAGSTAITEGACLNLLDAVMVEGCYAITDFAFDDPEECVNKAVTAAKAKFTSYSPPGVFYFFHAGVELVADAIKRAGSTDKAAIQKALTETKNLPTAMGTLTWQEKNFFNMAAVIMKFDSNKVPTTVKKVQ